MYTIYIYINIYNVNTNSCLNGGLVISSISGMLASSVYLTEMPGIDERHTVLGEVISHPCIDYNG